MPPRTPSTATSTAECFRPASKSGRLASEGACSSAASSPTSNRGLSPQSRGGNGGRMLVVPAEDDEEDGDAGRYDQALLDKLSTGSQKAALIGTAAKTLLNQAQKTKDLAVGEKINDMFKNPASRRDPESLNVFWQEVKKRLLRKHGTINAAFKYMDTSGDGSLTFLEFNAVLRQLLLPLDQRVSRAIFEQATGGDHNLSLEELKGTLMAQTIKRLCVLMERFNTKQRHIRGHVDWFLKNLVHADMSTKRGAVVRFSKKLTLEFCRGFWRAAIAMGNKDKKSSATRGGPRAKELDCATFVHLCVDEADKARFQVYDEGFLMRIYQRVDRAGRGLVSTLDLVTALALLSVDGEKLEKLRLLFDVFDSDYDGCLLYDQILAMCCTICVQRPVPEHIDTSAFDACVVFQDELGLQEGRRLFEAVFWHLSRHSHVEGGIVSWAELINVFVTRPDLLTTLMPGSFSLDWTIPEGVEALDDPVARRQTIVTPSTANTVPQTRNGSPDHKASGGFKFEAEKMGQDNKTTQSSAFAATTPLLPSQASRRRAETSDSLAQPDNNKRAETASTLRSAHDSQRPLRAQGTMGRQRTTTAEKIGFNASNGFSEGGAGAAGESDRFRQETVQRFRVSLRKAARAPAHGRDDGLRPTTGMQVLSPHGSLPASPSNRGLQESSSAGFLGQGWMDREKASMQRWAAECVGGSKSLRSLALAAPAGGQDKPSHTASAPSLGRMSSSVGHSSGDRPSSQAGHPRKNSLAGNSSLIPAAKLDVPREPRSIQMDAEDIIRQAERRSHKAVDLRYEAEKITDSTISRRAEEEMRSSQGLRAYSSRWGSEDHHGWSVAEHSHRPSNHKYGEKLVLPPGIREHIEHRTATRWGGEASDRFRIFAGAVAQSRHDGGASAEKLRWGGEGIDYRCDLCCEKHEFLIG